MDRSIFTRKPNSTFRKSFQLILATTTLLLLQGCFENKPSTADLKAAIVAGMNKDGNIFSVSDVDIEAQENAGDSVDPRWKSRFTVTYKTNMPFYKRTGSDSIATFVTESQPAGFTFTVPYTATSTLNSEGKWQSMLFRGTTKEINNLGDPLLKWSGIVVRAGNEGDKAMYDRKVAEIEKEKQEKQKKRQNLLESSFTTLQDNTLTRQAILGSWRDRCNNQDRREGIITLREDGVVKWDMQDGTRKQGKYSIDRAMITFVWNKYNRKTEPTEWQITILTEDNLELLRLKGNKRCAARRL